MREGPLPRTAAAAIPDPAGQGPIRRVFPAPVAPSRGARSGRL